MKFDSYHNMLSGMLVYGMSSACAKLRPEGCVLLINHQLQLNANQVYINSETKQKMQISMAS